GRESDSVGHGRHGQSTSHGRVADGGAVGATGGASQRGCLGRQHTFRNELRRLRWPSYLGFFREDKSMNTAFIGLARNAARPHRKGRIDQWFAGGSLPCDPNSTRKGAMPSGCV